MIYDLLSRTSSTLCKATLPKNRVLSTTSLTAKMVGEQLSTKLPTPTASTLTTTRPSILMLEWAPAEMPWFKITAFFCDSIFYVLYDYSVILYFMDE